MLTFVITLTKERLIRLLENPELLTSISFEELKTLALAYPYAHNLRYLLAIKAQQELFEQRRAAELAEAQRLEAAENRRVQEKARRCCVFLFFFSTFCVFYGLKKSKNGPA